MSSFEEDISNLEAGVYSIVATDENSNIASIVIELTEPETLSIAENHSNYTGYGVSCNGEFDGFIDVTITGGTGTYTYNWNNGASSNEDLTDLAAGIYSLIATDENGCSTSIEVELTEPEIIQFSGIQSDYLSFGTSCNGSSDGFIYTMEKFGIARKKWMASAENYFDVVVFLVSSLFVRPVSRIFSRRIS